MRNNSAWTHRWFLNFGRVGAPGQAAAEKEIRCGPPSNCGPYLSKLDTDARAPLTVSPAIRCTSWDSCQTTRLLGRTFEGKHRTVSHHSQIISRLTIPPSLSFAGSTPSSTSHSQVKPPLPRRSSRRRRAPGPSSGLPTRPNRLASWTWRGRRSKSSRRSILSEDCSSLLSLLSSRRRR